MSEITPEEALQNFADWMSPMDPSEIESVYGLTHKHAHLVLCELRQLRTALSTVADTVIELSAKLAVAELENIRLHEQLTAAEQENALLALA